MARSGILTPAVAQCLQDNFLQDYVLIDGVSS